LKIQASSGKLYVASFGRGTWRIPLVPGTERYSAQVVSDLVALSATVGGMGIAAGPTTQIQNAIESIRKEVKRGDSPCADLDGLKSLIAGFVPKKVSAAQQAQLNSAIDAIRAETPC